MSLRTQILIYLVVIAIEECEVAGLGSGGSLDSAELQFVAAALQVAQVAYEVHDPERGAFADGGHLCGLEVGKAEAGQVAIFGCERAERVDHRRELADE